jgi:predicted dehydrogenase
MSAQPIRTTVLGAGLSLSAFHYPIITSYPNLFTLHSVLERSADLTPNKETGKSYTKSATKDRCGEEVKVVKTLEEVVGDEQVELVVIGVPNGLHFDYAKQCMEAGKHGTPGTFQKPKSYLLLLRV